MKKVFTTIGFFSMAMFSVAMYLDIRKMDRTEGGYEYPYENETGEIIDRDSMDLTQAGLVRRGYVLDFLVYGITGMISLELLGFRYKARQLSDRAIKVHKPRQALIKRGFKPEF